MRLAFYLDIINRSSRPMSSSVVICGPDRLSKPASSGLLFYLLSSRPKGPGIVSLPCKVAEGISVAGGSRHVTVTAGSHHTGRTPDVNGDGLGGSRSGRKGKANTMSVINAVVRSITECEKPMCMLQEQEAYSKLFYTTCVQPTVKGSLEKAAQEHRTLTNGEHITLVKKETAMLYAQESPDIKDQVKQYLEDQKQQRIQDKQIGQRQMCGDYSRNLDKLAAVANSFLKGLAEATGMSFSLLAGGPSPEALGTIDIYSFHVSQTKLAEAGVSSPQQQEGSSGTGGDTRDSLLHLDIYKSGSTSGSISNALSTGDVSLQWSDMQSTQHNTSLDGLFLQSPILPESLTMAPLPPLPPLHSTCDDWTPPDLDIFLSNLDVQMGLEPLAGASEISTLTMVPLPPASPFTASTATLPPDTSSSILPTISHTPQLDTTSTPPPDTILNTLPTISHIPPPVTTSGHPPDTSSSTESLTGELPLSLTTPSFDADPLAPTPGSNCLDDIDINDEPVLETRRTKHIPKPSTRNDTANTIGASQKENKHPQAEMSSDHGSKREKV
ncbi:uncharacterized protein F5891DRAFT_985460 [Suillus fuscotomentosus]|uniref:Uncharacterized protein n=1 Tax=Suillus fuscotomentosus TaxID=1912939 RepID=A0AAD4DU04_9AGAM|nr:uncharacterized protein F5891DRAFT_985460 [Suillus fuscotomentosus]KAG1893920.1 hypothetical protein F5891DRAFT_985460 [Suillus fuscotomentosus]